MLTDDGRLAAPGEPGILVHRGPTVSLGYWRRPEDTARVLRPNPLVDAHEGADTVCISGDRVIGDADGYFTFVGRDDAIIKSSGHRISPAEVEEAIMATGQFRQCAVIGLADDFAGQVVHAVAVPLRPDAAVDEVRRTLAGVLPALMVPRRIELVEDLATTPNGKVDYPRLIAERRA